MSRLADLVHRGVCIGAILLLAGVPGLWLSAEARRDPAPPSAPSAPQAKSALLAEPASPYRWCDLAEALAAAGERDQALYALNRAVARGPNAAPILMRAVNFHVLREEATEVLQYSARVLRFTSDSDGLIFSYFDLVVQDASRAAAAISGDDRSATAYLRYLMATRQAGAGLLGIEIVRNPSRKFDNKIKGTAWVDRVELAPAA